MPRQRSLLARLLADTGDGSRPAVVSPGRTVSRSALLDEAGRVAAAIRAAGVLEPESRVGLLLDRGPEWFAAALGAWGAGTAWVPVSTEWPTARSRQVLADAGASLVLTTDRHATAAGKAWDGPLVSLDGPLPVADRSALSVPDAGLLAYVLYTSGSTGRPKGVAVEHGSIANYVELCLDLLPLRTGEGVPLFASLAFDFTLTSALVPLAAGEPVHAFPGASAIQDVAAAMDDGRRFSLIVGTPSQAEVLFYELARHERAVPPGALVLAGEVLRAATVRAWWERWPGLPFFNLYGPTETTVACTFHRVRAADLDAASIPIGRATPGSTAFVLDARLAPVPAGQPGELCMGGCQVARGYLNQPALTASRFVPDPTAGGRGGRLYRTGDLARIDEAGDIEFLGRIDRQVKVRGHRIEPAEVEGALLAIDGVEAAAVLARELPQQDMLLVAFVAGAGVPGSDVLRAQLQRVLPPYMVPARITTMRALPFTDSGKVDATALLARDATGPAGEPPPTSPLGHLLAACRSVLGRRDVTEADGFLALGGDSLAAARVGARLRAAGLALPLDAFLRATTLGDLATHVVPAAAPTPPERPAPQHALSGWRELSSGQQRLLFLWLAAPADPAYNVPAALSLDGPLDEAALRTAITALATRHAMLRARFDVPGGHPRQRVDLHGPGLDVLDVPGAAREQALLDWGNRPFDLLAGPPSRFVLLRHDPSSATLLVCAHHIVVDRWSMDTILAELAALYVAARAGAPADLPPLPASFADHVDAERTLAPAGDDEAYWREVTAEPPTRLLPDRVQAGDHRAAVAVRKLRRSGEFRDACRRLGLTPFMGFVAHVARWLAHATGREEACFGTIEAGRTAPALDAVVGFFANTVPLRVPVDDRLDWQAHALRVRDLLLESSRRTLPFARVVELARAAHGHAGATDFDVVLVIQNTPRAPAAWPELRVTAAGVPLASAKFPLTLSVEPDEADGLRFEAEYRAARFEHATVEAWLHHLEAAIEAAIDTPTLPLARLRDAVASGPGPAGQLPRQVPVTMTVSGPLAPVTPTEPIGGDHQPADDTERRLAGIWAELLGAPVTSRQAHFFEAGGHSLLAARLAFRIQQEFGVRLPVTLAHTHGTLASLASAIDAARRDTTNASASPIRRRTRPTPPAGAPSADNPSD